MNATEAREELLTEIEGQQALDRFMESDWTDAENAQVEADTEPIVFSELELRLAFMYGYRAGRRDGLLSELAAFGRQTAQAWAAGIDAALSWLRPRTGHNGPVLSA